MESASPSPPQRSWSLLLSVFLVVGCGIVYELLIAAYSAHLHGDSLYRFSLTIGLFLSAMGVGSYFTQRVEERLVERLLSAQLWLAGLGGSTVLALSLADMFTANYHIISHCWTVFLGALVGYQLPLAIRIVEQGTDIKQTLARVLFLDYIGALAGSLALPWYLMPRLGFAKTSLFVGGVCLASAGLLGLSFRQRIQRPFRFGLVGLGLLLTLVLAWDSSERLIETWSRYHTPHSQLVYLKRSPYQELRFTRYQNAHFLSLNRQPQFSTQDEHRYHESLVHFAMGAAPSRKRVLLLGGGDGLALREIWKYHDVDEVTMVDLDPMMTQFGQTHPVMRKANQDAMRPRQRPTYCLYSQRCQGKPPSLRWQRQIPTSSQRCPAPPSHIQLPRNCRWNIQRRTRGPQRLQLVHRDAWKFVETPGTYYSVILSDLPDATNISLSKLYSVEFYRMLRRRLAPNGMMAVQSTALSPAYRRGYWCIRNTIQAAGWHVRGYHVWVPSFSLHTGFTLAGTQKAQLHKLPLLVPTRYLNREVVPSLFWFPKDMNHIHTPPNRIDTHILLRLLLHG